MSNSVNRSSKRKTENWLVDLVIWSHWWPWWEKFQSNGGSEMGIGTNGPASSSPFFMNNSILKVRPSKVVSTLGQGPMVGCHNWSSMRTASVQGAPWWGVWEPEWDVRHPCQWERLRSRSLVPCMGIDQIRIRAARFLIYSEGSYIYGK